MAGRRLSAEEDALWRQIAATVRPLVPHRRAQHPPESRPHAPPVPAAIRSPAAPVVQPSRPPARPAPGDTLDGGWDRRLRRGIVSPDLTIDLHGHTLASAHALLDSALERALANDARLILLITGRPPRPGADGTPRRGLIRASIGDWLAGSRHAGRIAAVRNAHPRHGGAGALYIVLRRLRER